MNKAFYGLALLAIVLSACSLPGASPAAPAAPVEATQDPAVDTAIANLVVTQMAATEVGTPYPALATAGPQSPSEISPAETQATLAPAETAAPEATQPPPAAPSGAVLPAPLLFLSAQNDSYQVWRLDTDGQSLKQLTNEDADVTEYDVSPSDGRLAYVSGNDLYVANPDGSGKTLLVDGPLPPPENDPQRPLLEIGRPRWSSDGQNIAYRLGGVNIIPSAGGAPAKIIASDPLPQPPDYKTDKPVYNYWPESWAPDGKRLLIGYSIWPESGGLAVLNTSGQGLTPVKPVESFACCNPVWSLDGSGIFYSNPYFGMILAGLWRSDAATGESQTLIQGDAQDGMYYLPGFATQAADGKLYFFYGKTDKFPEGDVMLAPVSAEADGKTNLTPLRTDYWLVGEALWAPDGRGVVILDMSAASPEQTPLVGGLVYLKSDNSPALPLPAMGSMLRWGK